jgi:hypothetical protein
MELETMVALEEARPLIVFEPDWNDVLGRACEPRRAQGWGQGGPRRRARSAALVLAVAVATAIAITPAFGVRGRLGSFFSLATASQPRATWNLVGPRVAATGQIGAAARLTRVHQRTLRRIVSGGSGYRQVSLIGAIGEDGKPWLGQQGPGWASAFFPLFGPVGEVDRASWRTRTAHGWDGWQFPMYGRSEAHRLVFSYLAFGGTQKTAVTWATLIGFARSDVARVTAVTVSGATRPLHLGRGGGYAYAAVRPEELPRELRVFDKDGRLIGLQQFRLEPLEP